MDKRHTFYWIFGAVAFVYAIWAISRCSFWGVNLKTPETQKQYEAFAYLLSWTFGPPLWFMVDWYVFRHPLPPATDLTGGQKLAAAIWAAVFATILELVKPG
jgi:hypothetical protein